MDQLKRYEVLFLTVPEITADETTALESQLEKKVKEHKGIFISYDRWGKYRLAYPIRKNDYGVYFLVRFEVTSEQVEDLLKDINDFFKIKYTDLIMRYLISRLDSKKSLEYQRPQSLEEVPTREVESFLKDTKRTTLMEKDTDLETIITDTMFDEDRSSLV